MVGCEVVIMVGDGFVGLKVILLFLLCWVLVLIDFFYEICDDYSNVVKGLKEVLKCFLIGIYVLWYLMFFKLELCKLLVKLKGFGVENWLYVLLEVSVLLKDGYGMNGSGMFIINLLWMLEKKMYEMLFKLIVLFV